MPSTTVSGRSVVRSDGVAIAKCHLWYKYVIVVFRTPFQQNLSPLSRHRGKPALVMSPPCKYGHGSARLIPAGVTQFGSPSKTRQEPDTEHGRTSTDGGEADFVPLLRAAAEAELC
jgi:hypothetical protein